MDERDQQHNGKPLLWIAVALAALAAVVVIVARRWSRIPLRRRRPVEGPPVLPEVPPGLTEEEASARWWEGQDNAVHLKPPRTRQQIWHENIYTVFNLSLVGLAITQALLGQWLSALLSLGTIALNVGINVGQEILALRRLAAFQRSARPKATVVREGKTRSVDPDRVVPGDVLIIGPGDQFLVDGQAVGTGRMVLDASAATGKRGWQTARAGDPVYAGSFCISGRGAYVAQKVGNDRLIVRRMADMPALAEELTPLERIVDRILRILLVLVAVFAILLLLTFFRRDLGIPVDLFNDAASVIFNIAPSGLFLMIIVTYTTGTADLARLGALVHRARSVESLAEATVICFAEAGILAGTTMEMEPIQRAQEPESVPESRLRQILGDYARSTSASNLVIRILIDSFEGSQRAVREESPFLAAYGWSAIIFDEPDLRGVYVLGEPAILEGHLAANGEEVAVGASRSPAAAVRRLVSPLGRLLKRGAQEPAADVREDAPSEGPATGGVPPGVLAGGPGLAADVASLPADGPTTPTNGATAPADGAGAPARDAGDGEETLGEAEERQPLFRRWTKRIRGALRRDGRVPEGAEDAKAAPAGEAMLMFAYCPEPMPLHDAQGNVQLPEELIPLCALRYAQRLRPDAVQIVRGIAQTGVSIKVFASGEPDRLVDLFQQVGSLIGAEGRPGAVGTVSGQDLEGLPRTEWARIAAEKTIFGHITPTQGGVLVRALRESGESVAVIGDGVTDLPALQQANLAIARQTSTQAALGVADIVMMGNSTQALLQVLHKGQRIVHGLLDVLKLNLAQVFYLALLIAAIRIASVGFPYVSAQGTAIVVITVTLPSVGLSFWATQGVVSSARFRRILGRFLLPAAVSMSLAALLVYIYFLERTGELTYAQLGVTYTLIYAGLLLAVFVKPPWTLRRRARRRFPAQEGRPKREWRMAGGALVLGVAAFFLPAIPAAQKFLKLDWLRQPADYGIVGLAVVGWALILNIVWWLIPPAEPEFLSGGYSAPPQDEGGGNQGV